MRVAPALFAFNRGLVSRLGLARVDLERIRLSAEEQTNWMPRALGSMTLRPGLEYLGSTLNDARACCVPFVFELDDQARLEMTAGQLRVWVDDAPVVRAAVAARLQNSGFVTNLDGWTDADEADAVSSWESNCMTLKGTGASAARRWQQVAVGAGQSAVEHAIRVVVARGPITLKIGAVAGSDDMLAETTLAPGVHSLAFTPNVGSFFVDVSHRGGHTARLDAIQVEFAGDLKLPTPYGEADLAKFRWSQSRDVIFLACDGYQQRRVERRGPRSWSFVRYESGDGPFRDENLTRVTLQSSDLDGDATLTASADLFRSGHVGALFRLSSSGQRVEAVIAAENTFTLEIRVTGVGADRQFQVAVGGTGAGTVTLQRSVGVTGDFSDVKTFGVGTATFDDDLDNQVIFYRVGVKTGDYSSGTIDVSLTYGRGSIDGVARVTAVSSPTTAAAIVLKAFGSTEPTAFWAEGEWSDFRGWPTAVRLFQGRLWWGGRGRLWGSASDAFDVFDASIEGDAAPIAKTITDGPADVVSWIGGGRRLVLGAIGGALEARSSSLDEPLTPSACQLRRFATAGVANVPAVELNNRVLFVERAEQDLLEAQPAGAGALLETIRLTALAPELGGAGFCRLAVQHQPDVRVHAVRRDGTAAVLITDPAEDVRCWIEIETDGEIEDVAVLPSGAEDAVYYVVKRMVDGAPRRFHERLALESHCRGGALNRQADSFVVYDGPPTSVVAGLGHLEGETVVVWADGKPRAAGAVVDGAVAIAGGPVSQAVVGRPYEARFRSAKLAYGARNGAALSLPKRVNRIGFALADAHADGLSFGPDFATLDPLPPRPGFAPIDPDTVHRDYDYDGAQFPGRWDADARICLKATAPKPCTVLGVALDIETIER